jgi:hypothetical protein
MQIEENQLDLLHTACEVAIAICIHKSHALFTSKVQQSLYNPTIL